MSRPTEYEAFTFSLLETSRTDQSDQGASSGAVELEPQGPSDSGSSNTQLSVVALPTPISELGMNSSHGNDLRGGEASVAGRPPDSLVMANPQPSPNTTLSISFLSQATGSLGGGDQGTMTIQPPPPAPPPRCQIINPFMQTPPLAPLDSRLPPQATGSSLPIGQIGSMVQDNALPGSVVPNAFGQDLRHHRSYPNVMTLPPAFQVHPNLQSQIQAFHNDMNQHAHMTQPPGFLQGFIPTDMNIASVVQQAETNNRASHLLQPHVRQRARRRSRANRALQHHAHHHATHHHQQHDGGDAEGGGMGLRSRSLSEVPTARVSVLETGGGYGDTSLVTAAPAAGRLDDSKLKGLEENYSSIGENFECNICFQKANEAVVTCCGHLFCWPCLYRWLHIHSYHKECPVCKGAIDENSITPIYGRECSALLSARGGLPGGSAADRIPPRPPARRVESARQLRDREDRGREREQRERALERERERDQQDSRGLSDLQVLGSGTTLQIEEAASVTVIRDGVNNHAGQPTPAIGDEITSHEGGGHSSLEELDQSEGPTHDTSASGEDGGSRSQTNGTGGSSVSSAVQQDLGTGVGNGANNTGSAFLQRRMSERREQLRAALAASVRNGMNSASIPSLTDRVDERRQIIAAAALLSQEWEDIVNISRMVGPVNPAQGAAWMTAMQGGRLSGMEGTTTDNFGGDFTSNSSRGPGVVIHTSSRPSRPQHHMPQILLPTSMDVGISGAGGGNESSLSRLVTVHPVQSGDWLAAVRSRLSSVEKIVENLETTPLQLFQQSSSGLLHVNHSLPAQSSSLHSGPLILENVTNSTVANSEPAPTPGRRLVEEICPNLEAPRTCTSVIVQSPSTRRLDEQTVTAVEQPQAAPSQPEPGAAASGGVATPDSSYDSRTTTTQADIRLHYREAPLSRPSSSRRRSSRMEDVANAPGAAPVEGSGFAAGTGGAGHETIRSRSKRRRLN